MQRRIWMAALVVVLLGSLPALAANPMAGKWRASSGFVVTIPDSTGDFELVFEGQGDRITHPARWVVPGRHFQWTDKQGNKHDATLDEKNPNRICDINSARPRSSAYWYRLQR